LSPKTFFIDYRVVITILWIQGPTKGLAPVLNEDGSYREVLKPIVPLITLPGLQAKLRSWKQKYGKSEGPLPLPPSTYTDVATLGSKNVPSESFDP
jgi:hypothetical protein